MEPGALNDLRFVGARRRLIEQIRAKGIEDLDLLQLFDQVPRHLFVPEGVRTRAYEDAPLPIGYGQTVSQPSLQALLLQILEPTPQDRVLEIGTGSGYLTALLALAAERVYSVERVRELSTRARFALDAIGLANVALMVGDGSIGWRKFAPYDVITVSAASPSVPRALTDQLADRGRLLLPVGTRRAQTLVLIRREGDRLVRESLEQRCTFVPLLGRYGWGEEEEPGSRRPR